MPRGVYPRRQSTIRKMEKNQTGQTNNHARLTEEEILEIRASPLSSRKIAPMYGVNDRHIRLIRSKDCWKHL